MTFTPGMDCCFPGRLNTLRPRQNGRRFADDTFKRIFLNENVRISIKISLKFVPKGSINNNPALVQIMAWRWSGDKPLSEPMMVSLLTHICITQPQWVNSLWAGDAMSWHKSRSTLAQIMACCLTSSSHYLNQCRPAISEALSRLPQSNSTLSAQANILHNEFENDIIEIIVTAPRGQWVKYLSKWSDTQPVDLTLDMHMITVYWQHNAHVSHTQAHMCITYPSRLLSNLQYKSHLSRQ